MYQHFIKRFLDIVLSLLSLVLLLPLFLLLSAAIWLDDPGPVLFSQKRFGKGKRFFRLHKFRSMRMDAPHDVPTHLLQNPRAYITRVGRFLRRSSLDELPQLWDIFVGHMSFIGPRPALWNQLDLMEARARCGANDVRPGLTGWAQINGRDELSIEEKAKLDGVYARAIQSGGWQALRMDLRCFFGTFRSVFTADGVAEGTDERSGRP